MNQLSSRAQARALFVATVSGLVAVTGLGTVPSASAAPGAQISGTVTDDLGAPLKDIRVSILSKLPDDNAWEPVGEATTKNDGSYVVKKLDPGAYQVFFGSTGGYVDEYYDDEPRIEDASDVAVDAGQSVTGIDASLDRTGEITGTVTDESGAALGGIDVTIMLIDPDTGSQDVWGGTTTADDGSYLLPDVGRGPWKVEFADPGGDHVTEYYDDERYAWDGQDVAVEPGETTAGIDAELAPAGHFTGSVTGPEGEAIDSLSITPARLVDGQWWVEGPEFGFGTDQDGSFDIGGMPAGTYRFDFTDLDHDYLGEVYDNVLDFDDATDVELTAGGSVALNDVVLDKAAHIEGTVTDDSGDPLEGISVLAYGPSTDPDGNGWEIKSDTETDADGRYSLGGLREATYRVEFQSEGDQVSEYYDDSLTFEDADGLQVDAGETVSDVDAELALAAHITGTVTGPDGQPGDDVGINAWRWTGSDWAEYSFDFVEQTEVDVPDDGHYDLGGLAPGTYRLEFGSFAGEHEWWNDQPSLELAQDVVVTEAGQVLEGYDARLESGQYPDEVVNTAAPQITGSPAVGAVLSATSGTWNFANPTLHYQWFAGGAAVGADLPSYTPSAGDVGKAITVAVRASVDGVGSATATSAPTSPVTAPTPPSARPEVTNLRRPVIKGTLEAGERVRVTTGRWSPADVTLAYKWYVGGKRIVGASGRQLLIKQKWVGKRLRVKVVARASGHLKAVVLTKRSIRIQP